MIIKRDPEAPAGGGGAPPPAAPPATPAPVAPVSVDDHMDKLLERDQQNQDARKEQREGIGAPKKDESTPPAPAPVAEVTPPPPAVEPTVPVVEKKGIDPEKILETLSEGFKSIKDSIVKPAEAAKPAVPTEPEFKAWKSTPEDIDDVIEGGEKGQATLDKIYQTSVKDSVTLMASLMKKMQDDLMAAIQPIQKHYGQIQVEAAEKRFFGEYKDLEPVADLTREVAQKILDQIKDGKRDKYPTEAAFFKDVAQMTNKYIEKVKGIATGAPADNGKPKPTPPPTGGGSARSLTPAPRDEDQKLGDELLKDAGLGHRGR